MKRIIPLILSLLLLCGCAAPAGDAQEQDPPPTQDAQQEASTPYPSKFETLPVTKDAITALYESEAFYQRTVEEITPYEGDFLVRYANLAGHSAWDWIYGETGRIVNMISANEEIADVSAIRPGHLRVTTTGVSNITAQKTLPRTYEVVALGTEDGLTYSKNGETVNIVESALPTRLSVSEKAIVGYVDGNGKPNPGERYTQLYDARMDVDGLSFSFIPSGVPERYLSFFSSTPNPACYETSFDEESRLFTIRLYNTCLESGEGNDLGKDVGTVDESYGFSYPYSFPAGSLGRDNRFVKGVSLTQDGEDLIVLMTLTEHAAFYTVEGELRSEGPFSALRIVFSE